MLLPYSAFIGRFKLYQCQISAQEKDNVALKRRAIPYECGMKFFKSLEEDIHSTKAAIGRGKGDVEEGG